MVSSWKAPQRASNILSGGWWHSQYQTWCRRANLRKIICSKLPSPIAELAIHLSMYLSIHLAVAEIDDTFFC